VGAQAELRDTLSYGRHMPQPNIPQGFSASCGDADPQAIRYNGR
jgi:hypothetical protein